VEGFSGYVRVNIAEFIEISALIQLKENIYTKTEVRTLGIRPARDYCSLRISKVLRLQRK